MNRRDQTTLTQIRELLGPKGVTVSAEQLISSNSGDVNLLLVRLVAANNALGGEFLNARHNEGLALVVESKQGSGPATYLRSLELSQSLVFVAAVSEQGELKWWTTQPDPRIVRAETSNERGELSGKTLYKTSAEILVSYPADRTITSIRFYSPRWIDGGYELDPIGEVAVGGVE
jgi:hypothetical protein